MSTPPQKDRRRGKRIRLTQALVARIRATLNAEVLSLSEYGASIATEHAMLPGSVYEFRLVAPAFSVISARVKRCEILFGEFGKYEAALEFEEIDAENRKTLRIIVDRLQKGLPLTGELKAPTEG